MALSVFTVQKARPREKAYKLFDEKGLYLLVSGPSRWWRLDYRLAGKRKTISLGVYPDVGLADAREKRDEARRLVAAGVDPAQARKASTDDEGRDARFKTVACAWHEARRGGWSERYAATVINRLEANIFPELGEKPITDVAVEDVLRAIRKIEARGAIEAARRIKNYCSEVFEFAKAEGWAVGNPAQSIGRALKARPPKQRRAALKMQDLPKFLVLLRDSDGEEDATRDAMRLTLLTAVRTVETRFAAAEEFEDLDGPAPLWRLPPERMKMDSEHLVPLSRQATMVVRRRIAAVGGKGKLFAKRTVSGVISENTMLYALYRMGYHSKATVHGFRGSFSTIANETGWNKDWVERQLAHVERDEVRGAYNAAEYLPGRRKMLQWWADYLDQQEEIGRLVG